MVSIIRWLILLAWLFWIGVYWQAGRRAAADFARSMQLDHPPLDRWLIAAIGLMMPVISVTMLQILLQAVPGRSNARWIDRTRRGAGIDRHGGYILLPPLPRSILDG